MQWGWPGIVKDCNFILSTFAFWRREEYWTLDSGGVKGREGEDGFADEQSGEK